MTKLHFCVEKKLRETVPSVFFDNSSSSNALSVKKRLVFVFGRQQRTTRQGPDRRISQLQNYGNNFLDFAYSLSAPLFRGLFIEDLKKTAMGICTVRMPNICSIDIVHERPL